MKVKTKKPSLKTFEVQCKQKKTKEKTAGRYKRKLNFRTHPARFGDFQSTTCNHIFQAISRGYSFSSPSMRKPSLLPQSLRIYTLCTQKLERIRTRFSMKTLMGTCLQLKASLNLILIYLINRNSLLLIQHSIPDTRD